MNCNATQISLALQIKRKADQQRADQYVAIDSKFSSGIRSCGTDSTCLCGLLWLASITWQCVTGINFNGSFHLRSQNSELLLSIIRSQTSRKGWLSSSYRSFIAHWFKYLFNFTILHHDFILSLIVLFNNFSPVFLSVYDNGSAGALSEWGFHLSTRCSPWRVSSFFLSIRSGFSLLCLQMMT